MEYLIGIMLALVLTVGATTFGLDRERVFYPAMMIAIAANYILFGAISGSGFVVMAETIAAVAFIVLAVIGFKTRLWLVVAALAGHGVFDLFHHLMIDDSGVPLWWPEFCLAFDVVAAAYLAVLLLLRPNLARPSGLKYSI